MNSLGEETARRWGLVVGRNWGEGGAKLGLRGECACFRGGTLYAGTIYYLNKREGFCTFVWLFVL